MTWLQLVQVVLPAESTVADRIHCMCIRYSYRKVLHGSGELSQTTAGGAVGAGRADMER